MAKKRKRSRGRPSSIDLLPEDLRVELNAALRDKRITQADILEQFNGLLVGRGQEPLSRSALSRYAVQIHRNEERMRAAREAADKLCGNLNDAGHSDLGRAGAEILKSLVFDKLLDCEDDEEALKYSLPDLQSISYTLKNLAQASKADVDREARVREQARKEALAEAAAKAEAVEREAGKAGLTAEQTLERVRAIYRGEA